ncbi:argininosuccinate lyase C-terminal-domain-containing protein, partial [Chaetomium fimeti]
VLAMLKIHGDKMKAALTDDMLATDIADYLVRRGVPFRQTHHIAGAIVRKAEKAGVSIPALPLGDLKEISPLFEDDVAQVFDFRGLRFAAPAAARCWRKLRRLRLSWGRIRHLVCFTWPAVGPSRVCAGNQNKE